MSIIVFFCLRFSLGRLFLWGYETKNTCKNNIFPRVNYYCTSYIGSQNPQRDYIIPGRPLFFQGSLQRTQYNRERFGGGALIILVFSWGSPGFGAKPPPLVTGQRKGLQGGNGRRVYVAKGKGDCGSVETVCSTCKVQSGAADLN